MTTALSHRQIAPALLCACLLTFAPLAPALMAGAAPDSPAARVDANTADSPWAGVVALHIGNGVYTGVAISPRHILTAGHVAGSAHGNPDEIQVVVNAAGDGSTQAEVAQIDMFPGYAFPYDDLALLTLKEALPEGTPVYPINDLPPQPGQTLLTMVGYGASGNGDTGVSVSASQNIKRVGENVLDALASRVDTSGHTSSFYFYDFDGPEGNGPAGGPSLGNTRETVVAVGDSGAPAFTLINGWQALTGINTFATPLNSGRTLNYTFGQGGGGILLSDPRFVQWLLEKSHQEIHLISTLQTGWLERHWPWLTASAVTLSGLTGILWWHRRRA